LLQRAAAAVRLADNPDYAAEIRWREPDRAKAVVSVPAAVPVQRRVLTLDVSRLTAGEYDLRITMERRGTPPASSSRRFSIRP
jgi:hypothetical protein